MFEIKINDGNVVKIFKGKDEKAWVEHNSVNFDLETMINLIEEKKRNNTSISEGEIKQFEENKEMRKMVEDSEQDIEQGKMLSTNEVINKIKRGEI